ncbi:MAG: iron-sulfur cluster assembly scaffold protein [Chthonomonadales bacterium]
MSLLVQSLSQNATNLGHLPHVDATGRVGVPGAGHYMVVELAGNPSRIEAASFQTYGCPNAIACGQFVTTWIVGRPASDTTRITPDDLMKVLGGLPLGKEHCAALAVNALVAAAQDLAQQELQQ